MRLLIDNALSPVLAEELRGLGHDVLHIRDQISPDSSDEEVFELAAEDDRILVSADSDFGVLLALRQAARPSVILLRHDAPADPERQAPLLDQVVAGAEAELAADCVISVARDRLRLRMLPFA